MLLRCCVHNSRNLEGSTLPGLAAKSVRQIDSYQILADNTFCISMALPRVAVPVFNIVAGKVLASSNYSHI
jgi:hypothetical protein